MPKVEDISDLPDSVIQAAKDVFAMFDKDGGGSIDMKELGKMFEFVGKKSSEKQLNKMMNRLDEDGSGELEFNEFLQMLKMFDVEDEDLDQVSLDSDEENTVRKQTFEIFDKDGGGSINCEELAEVFKQMGRTPDMDEI